MSVKTFILTGGGTLLLLLSGCATDSATDEATKAQYLALMRSSNEAAANKATASAVSGAEAVAGALPSSGVVVSDDNVKAMASHMARDMATVPRLGKSGMTQIVVDSQYFDLENGLEMDRVLFAQRLRTALGQVRQSGLSFVEERQSGRASMGGMRSGSGKGGGGGKGSSGTGKGAGKSSDGDTLYRLEGSFWALTPEKNQLDAQRYEFQVVEMGGSAPVWMGEFTISTPLEAGPSPSK